MTSVTPPSSIRIRKLAFYVGIFAAGAAICSAAGSSVQQPLPAASVSSKMARCNARLAEAKTKDASGDAKGAESLLLL